MISSVPGPDLPPGWVWSTIGEVGEVQLGRQRSPKHHQGKDMRPYLRVANVFEDKIDLSDVKKMNFTPEEFGKYRLRVGDILLNEGQTPELVGRPAMIRTPLPDYCFQNTLIRFRTGDSVLPEFALAVFRHYLHSGRFTKIAQITTNIAHLGAARFSEIEFPVPPLYEQRRIVDAIESNFVMLDDASANLTNVERVLTAFWNSLHRSAFAGGLGDHHSSEVQSTSPPSRDELPEGWAWTTIGKLKEFSMYGPRFSSEEYRSTGTAIIRTTDMGEDASIDFSNCPRVELSRKDLERYRVRRGDLLITRTGSLGTLAVFDSNVDAIAGAFLIQYRLRVPIETVRYISHWLKSPGGRIQLMSRASGSGRPNLSSPAIDSIRVPLAPLEEQVTILRELEKYYSWVRAIGETVRNVRAQIETLRAAILRRALSGGLSASAQVVVSPPYPAESSTVGSGGPNTTQRRVRHHRRTPSAGA